MSDRPRRLGQTTADDRAVSDVVAFVFTFSIIITSVGVVSAVGFSVLEDVQADEQSLNAQRGFQSLGESFNEIDRSHVPGRSGEITLSEGALFVRTGGGSDRSTLGVSVDTDGDGDLMGGGDQTYSTDIGTLVYESQADGTRVAVESGAVIRKDKFADQAVMVQPPTMTCATGGSAYAVVSVVKFVSDDNTQGGDGTVQIVAREQSSTLLYGDSTATQVEVAFGDSRYVEAWRDHFESDGDWTVSGDTATCSVGGGQVIVRRTVIDLEFVG
jgi:hypothetical protein